MFKPTSKYGVWHIEHITAAFQKSSTLEVLSFHMKRTHADASFE